MSNGRPVRQANLAKPTGKRPDVVQGLGGELHFRPWLIPSSVEPVELSENVVDREVFQVFLWMLPSQPSLKENQAWKWMEWVTFTSVYSPVFKVLSWKVNKLLKRLELINMNVETALPIIHDSFRYRYCCVSDMMRPVGYLVSPHAAHGASWVWDPWFRVSTKK